MKSFYPNTKLKTDEQIVKQIKKLDNSKVRTNEMWEKKKRINKNVTNSLLVKVITIKI